MSSIVVGTCWDGTLLSKDSLDKGWADQLSELGPRSRVHLVLWLCRGSFLQLYVWFAGRISVHIWRLGAGIFPYNLFVIELLAMGRMSWIEERSCGCCPWLVGVGHCLMMLSRGGILVWPPSMEGPDMIQFAVHMLASSTLSNHSFQWSFFVVRMRFVYVLRLRRYSLWLGCCASLLALFADLAACLILAHVWESCFIHHLFA